MPSTIYALGGDDIASVEVMTMIFGGDGDDRLMVKASNDRIEGGLGADVLRGSSGSDRFAYRPSSGMSRSNN